MYINEFTALKEERKKETSPQNKEIKKEEKDPPKKNKIFFLYFFLFTWSKHFTNVSRSGFNYVLANKVGISYQ